MKYPFHVRHRNRTATIFPPSEAYTSYRVYYRHGGKARFRAFKTFSEARDAAQQIVKDLAKDSSAPALSAKETRDALALHYQQTGRTATALSAVENYLLADRKLDGSPLLRILMVGGIMSRTAEIGARRSTGPTRIVVGL